MNKNIRPNLKARKHDNTITVFRDLKTVYHFIVFLCAPGLVLILRVSLDPAMRGWMNDRKSYIAPVQLGAVMRAGAVGCDALDRASFGPTNFNSPIASHHHPSSLTPSHVAPYSLFEAWQTPSPGRYYCQFWPSLGALLTAHFSLKFILTFPLFHRCFHFLWFHHERKTLPDHKSSDICIVLKNGDCISWSTL